MFVLYSNHHSTFRHIHFHEFLFLRPESAQALIDVFQLPTQHRQICLVCSRQTSDHIRSVGPAQLDLSIH